MLNQNLIGKKWNTRESVFKRNKINKERGKKAWYNLKLNKNVKNDIKYNILKKYYKKP